MNDRQSFPTGSVWDVLRRDDRVVSIRSNEEYFSLQEKFYEHEDFDRSLPGVRPFQLYTGDVPLKNQPSEIQRHFLSWAMAREYSVAPPAANVAVAPRPTLDAQARTPFGANEPTVYGGGNGDKCGTGKTYEQFELIACNTPSVPEELLSDVLNNATLVVAPANVIESTYRDQLEQHVPADQFDVLFYIGSNRRRKLAYLLQHYKQTLEDAEVSARSLRTYRLEAMQERWPRVKPTPSIGNGDSGAVAANVPRQQQPSNIFASALAKFVSPGKLSFASSAPATTSSTAKCDNNGSRKRDFSNVVQHASIRDASLRRKNSKPHKIQLISLDQVDEIERKRRRLEKDAASAEAGTENFKKSATSKRLLAPNSVMRNAPPKETFERKKAAVASNLPALHRNARSNANDTPPVEGRYNGRRPLVIYTSYETLGVEMKQLMRERAELRAQSQKDDDDDFYMSYSDDDEVDEDDDDDDLEEGEVRPDEQGKKNTKRRRSLFDVIKVWWRIILDEAHLIRNTKRNGFHAVQQLAAINKWCMSATLFTNCLDDYFATFRFLGVIDSFSQWKEQIAQKPGRLDQLMRRYCMSRPSNKYIRCQKDERYVQVKMSPEQYWLYYLCYEGSNREFSLVRSHMRIVPRCNGRRNISRRLRMRVDNQVLRLMQMSAELYSAFCSMPRSAELRRLYEIGEKQQFSGKFNSYSQKVSEFLDNCHRSGYQNTSLCNVCLSEFDDDTQFVYELLPCRHFVCARCATDLVQLPSDREAEQTRRAKASKKKKKTPNMDKNSSELLGMIKGFIGNNNNNNNNNNNGGWIQRFAPSSNKKRTHTMTCFCTSSVTHLLQHNVRTRKVERVTIEYVYTNKSEVREEQDTNEENAFLPLTGNTVASAKQQQQSIDNLKSYDIASMSNEQIEQEIFASRPVLQALYGKSSKNRVLIDCIGQLPTATKCVVACKWTSQIRVLEMQFRECGLRYLKIEGSTPKTKRRSILAQFESGKPQHNERAARVLLMQSQTCGTGINILSASVMFLMNKEFNLATEEQQMSRIHRMNQESEHIQVVHLISHHSIEKQMQKLQRRKEQIKRAAMPANEDPNANATVVAMDTDETDDNKRRSSGSSRSVFAGAGRLKNGTVTIDWEIKNTCLLSHPNPKRSGAAATRDDANQQQQQSNANATDNEFDSVRNENDDEHDEEDYVQYTGAETNNAIDDEPSAVSSLYGGGGGVPNVFGVTGNGLSGVMRSIFTMAQPASAVSKAVNNPFASNNSRPRLSFDSFMNARQQRQTSSAATTVPKENGNSTRGFSSCNSIFAQ